jgi:hypothetical protein
VRWGVFPLRGKREAGAFPLKGRKRRETFSLEGERYPCPQSQDPAFNRDEIKFNEKGTKG